MKNLVLDINIILDMWLKRGNYLLIDELLDCCQEKNVQLWFPASALGTLDYILVRQLEDFVALL